MARLKTPFTTWPPMATLGRSGSEALAERFARGARGRARGGRRHARLRAGARHSHQPQQPGDWRSRPGRDRGRGRRGSAACSCARCRPPGIAACGKHFPGHGDTSTDSHVELPLVEHPPDRLRAVEFEPFRAAIAEQVAFIMTAHVLVPAFDDERPATLSPAIVQTLLREELGFDGVILSDDLEMKAVSARYPVPEAAVAAIQAGCDGLLICSGDVDLQGADARSADPRGRERCDQRDAAGRCDAAAARGPRSASCSRAPAIAFAIGSACCAGSWAARSIGWWPTKWRRSCDSPAAAAAG